MSNIIQKETLERIGNNIRNIRKESRLSQDGLAYLANTNQHTVSEIELGHRNVTILMLDRLATAMETSLNELVK